MNLTRTSYDHLDRPIAQAVSPKFKNWKKENPPTSLGSKPAVAVVKKIVQPLFTFTPKLPSAQRKVFVKVDTSAALSESRRQVPKARSKEEADMELVIAESLKESSYTSSEVVNHNPKNNSLPVPKAMKRSIEAIDDEEEENIIVEETPIEGNIFNPDFS